MIPDSVRKYVYYEEKDIVLLHGDCLDILPLFEPDSIDLVLTDPPYGISHKSNRTFKSTTAEWMNKEIDNDESTEVRDNALSYFPEWACFGSHKQPQPKHTRGTLIWDKGPASGMGDLSFPWKLSYELIFISGSLWAGHRGEGVIKNCHIVTRKSMGREHPNQKPVNIIKHLLNKHSGETILDPFLGSGTTAVAAKQLGRKCIGIELEAKYLDIAIERLRQEVLF